MSDFQYQSFLPWNNVRTDGAPLASGPDDRSGAVYLYDPRLKLAAEMAIVTRRPLLLRGEPGSGKSSFAAFAARNLGWRYYEFTTTGRTEARDLLWRFDALGRLRDAQRGQDVDARRYITPGVLWWTFNRQDALDFERANREAQPAGSGEPRGDENTRRDPACAVVLIDEIDKAPPDLPNDLLEVFSLNRFLVDDAAHSVERAPRRSAPPEAGAGGDALFVITTNEERELPSAFLRRCIVHTLQGPTQTDEQIERLVAIGRLHFPFLHSAVKTDLMPRIARKCCEMTEISRKQRRRAPSTAEFLDAVRICAQLGISPETDAWEQVEQNVFIK